MEGYLGKLSSTFFDNTLLDKLDTLEQKKRWKFIGTQPLYLGMELEVEFDSDSDRFPCLVELNDKFHDYIIFEEESSILNGFEIITHPMNMIYHYLITPQILKICKKHNAKVSSRTGIHFHIDKKSIDQEKIKQYFRNKDNKSHILSVMNREENTYCKLSGTYTDKYSALRETEHTLEMRIFGATLDKFQIFKYIAFIETLTRNKEINLLIIYDNGIHQPIEFTLSSISAVCNVNLDELTRTVMTWYQNGGTILVHGTKSKIKLI